MSSCQPGYSSYPSRDLVPCFSFSFIESDSWFWSLYLYPTMTFICFSSGTSILIIHFALSPHRGHEPREDKKNYSEWANSYKYYVEWQANEYVFLSYNDAHVKHIHGSRVRTTICSWGLGNLHCTVMVLRTSSVTHIVMSYAGHIFSLPLTVCRTTEDLFNF